jgi:galactokinase
VNRNPEPFPVRIPRLSSIADLYKVDRTYSQASRYEALRLTMDGTFPSGGMESGKGFFCSAPGRTELCGNHTDHNHGRVLAASVDLDTIAFVMPRQDSRVLIHSEGFGSLEIDLSDLAPRPREAGSSQALVRGLAAALAEGRFAAASSRRDKSELRGFQACVASAVPPGSGLSSSAAFEVLVGAIISEVSDLGASPSELAMAGQYAENLYFGKPCGLMDQMASALGSVVAMDFGGQGKPRTETCRFDPGSHGLSLVIVATGGSHADLTDEYAAIPREMRAVAALFGRPYLEGVERTELLARAGEIRSTCGDRAFLRAWHFAAETLRPLVMAEAMERGDIETVLSVVRASGDSSWKYLQNVQSSLGTREEGLSLALALTEEFLGGKGACRVHGGGFAGTIQAYIPSASLDPYRSRMEEVFGPGSVLELRIRPYGVVRIERL